MQRTWDNARTRLKIKGRWINVYQCWVNQPSTNQLFHEYHGINGVLVEDTFFFLHAGFEYSIEVVKEQHLSPGTNRIALSS